MAKIKYNKALLVLDEFNQPTQAPSIMEDVMWWLVEHKGWTINDYFEPKNGILLHRNGLATYNQFDRSYNKSPIVNFTDLAKYKFLNALDWPVEKAKRGQWVKVVDYGKLRPSSTISKHTPYLLETPFDIFNGFNIVGSNKGTPNGYTGFFCHSLKFKTLSEQEARHSLFLTAQNYLPKGYNSANVKIKINSNPLGAIIRYKNKVIYNNGLWTKF